MSDKGIFGSNREHLVSISESGGVCVVDKRKLYATKGDTVAFKNATGKEIHIFFPEVRLFRELKEAGPIIKVEAGKTSDAFTVGIAARDAESKPDNHYPYAVFCAVHGDFAIASSNPVIIVNW